MSALRVGLCPSAECDEPVTLADLRDAENGAPIWRCGGGHHGPTVAGTTRGD